MPPDNRVMTAPGEPGRYLGRDMPRVEDARFLTGQGRYIADLEFEGLAHMVVVRSLYPHAEIKGVDPSTAMALPGVLGVWTARNLDEDGLGGIPWERRPTGVSEVPPTGDPSIGAPHPILAGARVLYQGQPVAGVVAETAAAAIVAAEAVLVDYAPLTPLMDPRGADGAPPLWPQSPENISFGFTVGDGRAAAACFEAAAHVVSLGFDINRIVQNPLETRGYVGAFDRARGRYTLYATAGKPQTVGRALARDVFHLAEDAVRVVTKDVGGGFGAKNPLYPEQALVLWTAKRLGRTVRWLESRSEVFLADYQGRGQANDAELALDGEGRILAMRVRVLADLGGYLGPRGTTAPTMWRTMGTSVYDIPVVDFDVRAVHTTRMPTCPYRGAGAPEANFTIERLLDAAARELGIGPGEIRRRNLVDPAAMPYRTAATSTYDSGDFAANMTAAERMADTEGFAARRDESTARGRLRGIGYANLLEACGAGIADRTEITCRADGTIEVRLGSMSNGQSHETVYPQILAEMLDIDPSRVRIIQGDSDETPWGTGTGACRSMTVCGSALVLAAETLVETGLGLAADMLEAARTDVEYNAGNFRISGTDRAVSLEEVAADIGAAGLAAGHLHDPVAATFPNGCHIAEVEVDPETGAVALLNYVMAQDVGRALNPMVVKGQLDGGVAQGVGEALLERNVHDPESGQLLSGSFMDCAMPRADDLPAFTTELLEVPCTTNPLGIKSVGEAGPTAAPAAVVNAILDALAPLGVRDLDMPATSERVYQAIAAARRDD